MFLRVLILTFPTFFIFNSTVCCKPQPYYYEQYLISVLQHIEIQQGWNSKKHLILKHDNDQRSDVLGFLIPKTTADNYIIKLQKFVTFVNCRYTEILNTFNVLLERFLTNCGRYPINGMPAEFVSCALQLSNTVAQSAEFFKKLSAALTFIDQLDLRIIHPDMIKTDTIVDEVNTYLRFFMWKKTQVSFNDRLDERVLQEKVSKEYRDIKRFLDNNAKPNVTLLVRNAVRMCEFKNSEDLRAEDQMISSVDDISKVLVTFLSKIISDEYDRMGFESLINPDIYGLLAPPVNRWKTVDGQDFLKKLFTFPGWSKYTYIGLTHGNDYDGVGYLKTPIDQYNYNKIHSYTSRLIKHRYTEITLYFYWTSTLIINKCYIEKKINGSLQNFKSFAAGAFAECASYVYDTIKISVYMFKSMLIGLRKMKLSSKNKEDRDDAWPLEAIIVKIINYIEDFELNNYAAIDFNDIIANQFLESLETFLVADVSSNLRNVITVINIHCHSTCYLLFDTYFHNTVLPSLRSTPEEPNVPFQTLCEILNKFCFDVISDDFEQLGFHQAIF